MRVTVYIVELADFIKKQTMRISWSNSQDSDQAAHVHALIIVLVTHFRALDYLISSPCAYVIKILNDFSMLRKN